MSGKIEITVCGISNDLSRGLEEDVKEIEGAFVNLGDEGSVVIGKEDSRTRELVDIFRKILGELGYYVKTRYVKMEKGDFEYHLNYFKLEKVRRD